MISCSHWGLIPIPTRFKKYSWGWYNEIREMSYDSKYLHG